MARIISAIRRHPWVTAEVALLGAAVAAFVVVYFAPQDLLLDTAANDAFPRATIVPVTSSPLGRETPSSHSPAPTRPSVLVRGTFRSGEHHTTGTALLLKLPDHRVFLRLEDLDTSNGPDVRIWLSAADAQSSDETVQHARYVDLGGLKANHGNQNYVVPTGTDLPRYRSVVVWCRRFEVVFGAAPLRRDVS